MKPRLAVIASVQLSLLLGSLAAQTTGAITGRVFNPNTGEYVRNAQIRIEQSGLATTSESGGEYRLSPVAAGKYTVVVTYTGYQTTAATVDVAAGATISQ